MARKMKGEITPITVVSELAPKNVWIKRYKVTSFTDRSKSYVVALKSDGSWGCSCPAWKFRRQRGDCKHILYVKQYGTVDTSALKDSERYLVEEVLKII
jgi:hypothetical protein